MPLPTIRLIPALLFAVTTAACTDPRAVPTPHAVFVLPEHGGGFFALPWPTDLRLDADGRLDVDDFPNPDSNDLLSAYIDALDGHARGWGTNAPVFFTFSHAVDPTTLPESAEDSLDADSSVLLVDVDENGDEQGSLHPLVVHYRDEATIYWPAHCLAIRPMYGIPLAPGRTYAAVVTSRVHPLEGGTFARDADLEAVLGATTEGADEAVQAGRNLYRPVIETLEGAGIDTDDIVSLAVFTTQDPTAELVGIRDWMVAHYDAPEADDTAWEWSKNMPSYQFLTGRYGPSPIFQQGELHYTTPGTGGIEVSEDGTPTVAAEPSFRFALSVPTSEMPEAGYPIVLYAHGTGGDYKSFESEDLADRLGAVGLAMMGVDQIHHGERNPTGARPEYLFFNYVNPYAARDNVRQSALDVVQQARVVANLEVPAAIVSRSAPVRFDPASIFFYGHSQGGINGPLFFALGDEARAAVLSAAGGLLSVSIVDKTRPFSIADVVQLLLALPGTTSEEAVGQEDFVYEHPVLALVQTFIEPADGVNYAHLWFARPREGIAPRSVLMTEGVFDPYTPPGATEALATAGRVPIAGGALESIAAQDLLGLEMARLPASGNVAGGAATAGLLQMEGGHFVGFDFADARVQIAQFLRTATIETVPTIVAP